MAGAEDELGPAVDWEPSFPRIRAFDRLWCQVERWVCGAMFLVMSLLVFAAVVSAVFAGGGNWYQGLVLFGAAYLACRTRAVKEGEQRLGQGKCLGIAAAVTVVAGATVHYYTQSFPGGLPQAPALGMCLMLWVALLGASITTFERSHLALEFGEKLWPQRYLHLVKAAARAFTALCCVSLFWLSVIVVMERHELWVQGDHMADLVAGLQAEGLPAWVVLVIMPYTFAAMTIRMLAQSYTIATRTAAPEEEQLPT